MKQKTITASQLLAETAVKALQEKKGLNILTMNMEGIDGAIANYFVVCSGTSDRHVQALSYSVEDIVRKELADKPINTEGYRSGEWILMDYVDVVVHVFQRDKRDFFNIEDLWGDAEFKRYEDGN